MDDNEILDSNEGESQEADDGDESDDQNSGGAQNEDRNSPENPSQNNRDRKKEAKQEVKDRKKESKGEKKLQEKDKQDPLNQEQKKDKRIGHMPGVGGYAKAHRESARGQKSDAVKTLIKQKIKREIRKKLIQAAARNPWVWIVIGVIVLIILIIIIITGGGAGATEADQLQLTKTGPSQAAAGEELNYQITVSYPGQASNITITDRIPDGTEYIESNPAAKFDPNTKVATWNLSDYQAPSGAVLNNVNMVLNLKLRATADNSYLVNRAEGSATAYVPSPSVIGGGGPIAEGYVPPVPASTDCSGKYNFSKWPDNNPLGNFGDPQCNFSKDNLYTHLQNKESNPEFVNIWFNMVVPVESGYSPNAFAPPSDPVQCSLDCAGAWGLYQMGSSTPPGQSPPAPGKNGEYDRGDVNWEVQTTMAINYNRILLKCNFRYWQSALKVWGQYSC